MPKKVLRIGMHLLNIGYVTRIERHEKALWDWDEGQPGLIVYMLSSAYVQITQAEAREAGWTDVDALLNDLANAMDGLNV